MADDDQVAALIGGADSWSYWMNHHPRVRIDLSDAIFTGQNLAGLDLSQAYLRGMDLSRTDLSGANLSQADLSESDLSGATLVATRLQGAQLVRANLRGATLILADLTDANLQRVDLRRANLSSATLGHVNVTDARMEGTILGNVDLSTAQGLATIAHYGPSMVGVDTVFRSGGSIPDVFLKGAGIPEHFLTYIATLVPKSFQFYSCFISYASGDDALAARIHADLQQRGVRCWFAPEDMKIGDHIRPRIDQSIHLHDRLLLVLSKHSIASAWVEQEVETALERERRHGQMVLFPIRLDDAVMNIDSGWPALIRNTRHIGDFTRWKDHDAYQAALERLLQDLKA